MTASYLDMQAAIGISKHTGGLRSTRALHRLCGTGRQSSVLDVGCGTGAGPAWVARTFGCRVTGVDRSPQMVAWARGRAREEGVADLVDLQVADVLDLPLADDQFDVTVCESVLAFVADKDRAVRELVRVTRPGGCVGLSESFYRAATVTPELRELAAGLDTELLPLDVWLQTWEASGLTDRVVHVYRVDPGREVRDRLRWVGLRRAVLGIGRGIRLYLTRPEMRSAINTVVRAAGERPAGDAPAPPAWAGFGYGLFVGRKAG